ncbi:MAG: FAD-dependent oxidoreductase [Azospirillum sp.]|nr:FAD-dependent oxidoreductase [Azospirillum sp.]MCZ8124496.1 FAD-dependent oxidoreductase [Magnetospirillum sp.]
MKVLIVGAGIMGLATAWALTRAGHRVEVLDQGPIPNPLGTSVDQHRLIRYPYGGALGYTRMVGAAFAAWDRLWADLGETHYAPTGSLVFEAPPAPWASAACETLRAAGIAFRTPAPADIARRFAALLPPAEGATIETDTGGTLFAEAIVAGLARWLAANGARLRPLARVRDLDPARATATLEGGERVSADAMLVAAGPWTGRLIPAVAARMTPSRQIVVYVEPPHDLAVAWATHPLVLDKSPEGSIYVVPPRAGRALKIGFHTFSRVGDPDAPRVASAEEVAALTALCHRRLRRFAEYTNVRPVVCFYDVTEDENFLVVPVGPACLAVTGFSGHGFKFGAVLGERFAQGLTGEAAPDALAAWAAGRDDFR